MIFLILQAYFKTKDFEKLEENAVKFGATKQQFEKLCAFAAGFYSNYGNYHSFGDLKFKPELTEE